MAQAKYMFAALVRKLRGEAPKGLPCALVASHCLGDLCELWLACPGRDEVLEALAAIFDGVGPVLQAGLLDGSIAQLPELLANPELALREARIEGTALIECVARPCSELDPSAMGVRRLSVRAGQPRIARAVLKGTSTRATFVAGARVLRPFEAPPRLAARSSRGGRGTPEKPAEQPH